MSSLTPRLPRRRTVAQFKAGNRKEERGEGDRFFEKQGWIEKYPVFVYLLPEIAAFVGNKDIHRQGHSVDGEGRVEGQASDHKRSILGSRLNRIDLAVNPGRAGKLDRSGREKVKKDEYHHEVFHQSP